MSSCVLLEKNINLNITHSWSLKFCFLWPWIFWVCLPIKWRHLITVLVSEKHSDAKSQHGVCRVLLFGEGYDLKACRGIEIPLISRHFLKYGWQKALLVRSMPRLKQTIFLPGRPLSSSVVHQRPSGQDIFVVWLTLSGCHFPVMWLWSD